jgi:predicted phosphodiesterase
LISDVHGNLPALEQALAVLARAGARRLAFLGDYLGRGDSEACVQRIRQVGEVAVLGNRDLDWQERVSPDAKAWVLQLPRTAAIGPLLMAHGDARLTRALGTNQIVKDFKDAWPALEANAARVLAFGHSHQARTWRKQAADAPAEQLAGSSVWLEPGYRYFLNVGTTGLPFPGKGGPSVALLDLDSGRIEHLPL